MTQTADKTAMDRWKAWFQWFKSYFDWTNYFWWQYCGRVVDSRSYLSRYDIGKAPPSCQIKWYVTSFIRWWNSFMNWSHHQWFITHLQFRHEIETMTKISSTIYDWNGVWYEFSTVSIRLSTLSDTFRKMVLTIRNEHLIEQ